VVQRQDQHMYGWVESATFGRDIRAFLHENLPQVSAAGMVCDVDLQMDEGL
jgi:hypothetical protein